MLPVLAAIVVAGAVIKAKGAMDNAQAQADQERQNAAFYREQAAYAQETGERQRMIFDRASQVLYGEQRSGFAKAGIDTQSSAEFMAREILYRDQESYAIQKEADFNVRLAMLRANSSEAAAKDAINAGGTAAMGSLLGGGAAAFGAS